MKTAILLILALFSANYIKSQNVPVKINLISNGNKLDAKFYPVGKDKPSPTIVLLHGFPGNANNPLGLADRLNKSGINILVFNYQGTFSSDGIFNFGNCANDVGAAIDFLKQENNIRQFAIDTSRIVVCGYSLGASIALTAAVHNREINNIIAIAGGDLSIYLKKMAEDEAYRRGFEHRIASAYIPNGPIKGDSAYLHNYFDSIIPEVDNFDLVKNADKLKDRKILFITGWLDNTIPLEEFIIPVYRQLKTVKAENVQIKTFDTDHSFGNAKEELTESILAWTLK
jgi:dienelactone hydrolase